MRERETDNVVIFPTVTVQEDKASSRKWVENQGIISGWESKQYEIHSNFPGSK